MKKEYLDRLYEESDIHIFRNAPEIDLMFDTLDTLVQNGMFRDHYQGIPLSGSNGDFSYDDEEYREYARIIGCVTV